MSSSFSAVQALLDAIIQFFRRDVFRTAARRAVPVSGFSERFTLVWHFQQLIVLIKINFISLRSFHRFQFFFCERNVLVNRYDDDEWRSDGAVRKAEDFSKKNVLITFL